MPPSPSLSVICVVPHSFRCVLRIKEVRKWVAKLGLEKHFHEVIDEDGTMQVRVVEGKCGELRTISVPVRRYVT